jgi:hypothetical protein
MPVYDTDATGQVIWVLPLVTTMQALKRVIGVMSGWPCRAGGSALGAPLEALSNPSPGVVDPDITRQRRGILLGQGHKVDRSVH